MNTLSFLPNSPSAEQTVYEWEEYMRGSLDGVDADADYWRAFALNQDKTMAITHKLDRGLRDVSRELSLPIGDMKVFFRGKSVLDIGCGVGKFSDDVAGIKKTHVTALDHNPEVLDKVPIRKNLDVVEGSGYNLFEAIGDSEFDVVVTSFSSFLWARTPEERQSALDGIFGATSAGGTALIIPQLSNPTYRRQQADQVTRRILQNNYPKTERGEVQLIEDIELLKIFSAAGVLDIMTMDTIHEWQDADGATVSFRESEENRLGKLIQQRYSAIVNKK